MTCFPPSKLPDQPELKAAYQLFRHVKGSDVSAQSKGWRLVARAIAKLEESKHLAWGYPEAFATAFQGVPENGLADIFIHHWDRSREGQPCISFEIGFIVSDRQFNARMLLFRDRGVLHVPIVSMDYDGDRVLPVNVNPPILAKNGLTIAGLGSSSGAMRESPIFQYWRRNGDRFHLVQTVLHEEFTGKTYWLKRGHFVMEFPVSTPLTSEGAPWWPKRTRVEQWVFRGHRYHLVDSHWLDNAFLATERFLLALKIKNWALAERYAGARWTRLARIHHLGRRPLRFQYPETKNEVRFGVGKSFDHTIRVSLRREKGRWHIIGIHF